jgi:hypothetical protein
MPGEDAVQPKLEPETAAASAAQPADPSGQPPTSLAAPPVPAAAPAQPAQPTVIDKVVKAASDAVRGVADKAKPAPPAYPPELAADVEVMLESANARERRSAADKVFNYRPPESVAPHLRVIAELESARGCKTRKEAIAKMREQPDTRYLRSLQRLAGAPRNGCGFLNLADCYKCIRNDLRSAIDTISASLPSATQ